MTPLWRPSKEEWELWLEAPTTRWVLAALDSFAGQQKAQWDRTSWEQGQADPLLLCELRTRADAYRAIGEASYERLCELHGQDPVSD